MKYTAPFVFLFVLTLVFSSCLSVSYLIDVPQDEVISQYKTFELEAHCLNQQIGVSADNQIRIENAIFLNLRDLGMAHNAGGDYLVRYFVKNELKELVEGCEDYYDRWEGGVYCVERIHTYTEGTLVIDIIDRKKQKVVWHGAATGPVYDKLRNPGPIIEKVVDHMLGDFKQRQYEPMVTAP